MTSEKIIFELKNYILSNLKNKEDLSIGIEIENILYDKNLKRLKPDISSFISTEEIKKIIKTKNDFNISIEPGGQIEYASKPQKTLKELNNGIIQYRKELFEISNNKNIIISDFGTDSIFTNKQVSITKRKKYLLMHKFFNNKGHLSHEMMLNTSSIQLSLDYSSSKEGEIIAYLADSLHPFFSILFSNSPFWHYKPVGKKNVRELIWSNTDFNRCNSLFEHGIYHHEKLLDNYINFLLRVPTIFYLSSNNNISSFNGTLQEYLIKILNQEHLNEKILKNTFRQIFTNIRFKNILEIRGADTPPFGFELAPVAFIKGLLRNQNSIDKLLILCDQWKKHDRKELIELSKNLDLNKIWNGKKIIYWCQLLLEISINGLNSSEKIYLNSFNNEFLKNGPFTLSIQNSFNKSNLSIKKFIKKRWLEKKEIYK